jgi:hypothetical protein
MAGRKVTSRCATGSRAIWRGTASEQSSKT